MPSRATLALIAAVLAATASNAQAVEVGWAVDVHQNKFWPCANDFHVWGVVESLTQPPVISQVDNPYQTTPSVGPHANCGQNPLGNFNVQIGGTIPPQYPLPALAPPLGPGFYYFNASWSSDVDCIEFCHYAHFGLKFDVGYANVGYWLQTAWTYHDTENNMLATQTNPILSFSVDDAVGRIRLGNFGTYTSPLQQPAIAPGTYQVAVLPVGVSMPVANLNNDFFDAHPEITWTPVPGSLVPQYLMPDSFFDVFLELDPGTGQFTFSNTPIAGGSGLLPGQTLLMRQQVLYSAEGPVPHPPYTLGDIPLGDQVVVNDSFWQYELHGVTVPEPATLGLLMVGTALLALRRR